MRSKETATDYRYFPEPDLLPISLDQNYIDQIKKTLPELPLEKMNRYAKEHGLEESDAKFLSNDLELAQFYESCYELNRDSKQIVNWLKGEMFNRLSNVEITIKDSPVSPNQLCDLISEHQTELSQSRQPRKYLENFGKTIILRRQVIKKKISLSYPMVAS